jgi:AcrR family transcriptional regulator
MARTVGSSAAGTRGRILDGARELFVERGYAGTSIRDISERVGMTKGSLYYHFESKEQLLSALLTPLLAAIDGCVATAETADAVTDELLHTLVDTLDEHGPVLRALWGDPSVAHSMLDQLRLPQRLTALLEALQPTPDAAGRLRARCALGVINAGVLAPRDLAHKINGNPPPARPRLTGPEKDFVVQAALAVLTLRHP